MLEHENNQLHAQFAHAQEKRTFHDFDEEIIVAPTWKCHELCAYAELQNQSRNKNIHVPAWRTTPPHTWSSKNLDEQKNDKIFWSSIVYYSGKHIGRNEQYTR